MHSIDLQKPDGRNLTLYSRSRVGPVGEVLASGTAPFVANPHLRWHPLLGTWVAYAAYRQGRTFLPPPEYNPLAPSANAANPTELPVGAYDVAVFDNLFPVLAPSSPFRLGRFLPLFTTMGVVERIVDLPRDPQPVQEHGELPRHGHRRPFLGILGSPRSYLLPVTPEVRVGAEGTQDVVSAAYQQLS